MNGLKNSSKEVGLMDISTRTRRSPTRPAPGPGRPRDRSWIALAVLGCGLVANSLLGPLVFDVVDYPWSETMRNQTIGLESVSLFIVAPLCVLAGVLAIREHLAAPFVAFAPAAYTAYMFLQYVIGPEYGSYPAILPLHLALFILGLTVAVAAWTRLVRARLPETTRRSERRCGVLLLLLVAFVLARYLPALGAALEGEPLAAEFRTDVSMYWSIFLLDLGIVVPATIAAGLALLRGSAWGGNALFAVLGWFALVPPSVAAMGIAMVVNDDPHASTPEAIGLSVAASMFTIMAALAFRPLLRGGALEGELIVRKRRTHQRAWDR